MNGTRRIGGWAVALVALALVAPLPAAGAEAAPAAAGAAEPAEPPQPPPPPAPVDAFDRGTPRSSLQGYLESGRDGDWDRAAEYLELAPPRRGHRAPDGARLARRLTAVLDRALWVDLDQLSDDPHGRADDGLPANRDLVGTIASASGPVPVLVDRVPRGDGVSIWKISDVTVARIPALYREFGYGRLGDMLPAIFFEGRFLEIQLWQWIGLLLLVGVAWGFSWIFVRALMRVVRPAVERSKSDLDDRLLLVLAGPLRLVAAVAVFAATSGVLALSIPAERLFTNLEKAAAVVAVAWLVLRMIDVFGGMMEGRLQAEGHRQATALVPIGRKTAKAFVVALALLAGLDSFGFDVTALVAGLGIGGLAVALGLQKTLENLFGGVTLIADRPVQVGDFCRFGDKVGVVDEIGLRSTRVRTLGRTVISIPNAEFSALQLENFAARDKMWFNPRLGLRYETTPNQLRHVLSAIRDMLHAHPKVDPDPARIRFVQFGAYSLDLDVFAYVLTGDYGEYLEIAEDLNLRIMDIVNASGTGFAFPSSTTYLAKDEGIDTEKTARAEAEIRGAGGDAPGP